MIDPQNRVPLYPGRVTLTPVSGNTYDMERADQPTQEGTPLNRDTLRKLQADIRTYPIASGYSISAGDVVDVSGGQVVKTVEAVANVETQLTSSAVTDTSVIFLNENYSVVSVLQSAGVSALLVENKPGGALGNWASFTVSSPTNLSLARLSDTQFVVGYVYRGTLYGKIGTVSGTSIAFSSQISLSGASITSVDFVPVSSDLFFAAYNRTGSSNVGLKGVMYQIVPGPAVSGVETGPGITFASNLSATLLPDDASGNHRVCVCFSDGDDGHRGKAVIATIDSANQVTWGTVVTFESGETTAIKCSASEDTVCVAYIMQSQTYVTYITASGSTITVSGKKEKVNSGTSYYCNIAGMGSKFICAYSETQGFARTVNAGTEITMGAPFMLNDNLTNYPSIAVIDDNHLILAYADSGNSNYGTTTILEVMGDQIAGSFTNESSTAIALQSGTAGESIECIFSGTTNAAWVTEGQVIDSSGVYGVGIMDGILQVWNKERPGQVVTGSYVGTGTYGQSGASTLTVPKGTKLIIMLGYKATYGGDGANPFDTSAYTAVAICPFQLVPNEPNVFRERYGFVVNPDYSHYAWRDETTLHWYTDGSPMQQFNTSGITYYYMAIS